MTTNSKPGVAMTWRDQFRPVIAEVLERYPSPLDSPLVAFDVRKDLLAKWHEVKPPGPANGAYNGWRNEIGRQCKARNMRGVSKERKS